MDGWASLGSDSGILRNPRSRRGHLQNLAISGESLKSMVHSVHTQNTAHACALRLLRRRPRGPETRPFEQQQRPLSAPGLEVPGQGVRRGGSPRGLTGTLRSVAAPLTPDGGPQAVLGGPPPGDPACVVASLGSSGSLLPSHTRTLSLNLAGVHRNPG
ncbi:hypothetical protein HJG60_008531 [Phyllostomus discolor]|uniref:Uncharacterized protein n=1 Tax=Phyllostomus discolor TaxID=89673 RepID=A0A833YX17_9CHIR|nr:hypothetical protein HJG60_008531 [Phyllostomus discolor]